MAAPSTPFPLQLDTIKFGMEELYRLLDDLASAGVVSASDGAVTQSGAGSMKVDVAAGEGWLAYTTPYGGKRRLLWTATNSGTGVGSPNTADNWLSTFTTAHATLPRIDRVVATVQDASLDATGQRRQVFQVIPGTATSGATLVNLTGAAAVPANSLLLANVLVRAATSAILTADIDTTVRTVATVGGGRLGVARGQELAYQEFTSPVSVGTTAEASAVVVVTAPAIVFDGVTACMVEFYSSSVLDGDGSNALLNLWDGSTDLGRLDAGGLTTALGTVSLGRSVQPRRRLTPSAGSHTYSVRAHSAGGAGGTINAGAGGAGVSLPGYIRITRV